jgi:hypothetical protein
MAIQTIHPPCTSDSHCFIVWALRHGCYLNRDRGRERETTEWMATFIWCSAKKFGGKKWHQNNLGSNGREETSPGPLLLMIKVTYIILKNKRGETDITSQKYSWFAFGSIVIWNQLARPWYPGWWGLLSPWCCMKQIFVWNFLIWLLPSSVSEVRLIRRRISFLPKNIKNKMMSPTETPEICLVYPWEPPPQCTWCKQLLI